MSATTVAWDRHYFIRVQFEHREWIAMSMCDGQGAWWTARDYAARYHVPVVVTYGTESDNGEVVYRIPAK